MKVLLTHGDDTLPMLQKQLEASGCRVVHIPLITQTPVGAVREPPDKTLIQSLHGCFAKRPYTRKISGIVFEWIAFASRNGVKYFPDIDVPIHVKLAAVGEGTAQAVRERFGRCDLVNSGGDAASLCGALLAQPNLQHVLLPCAREGRDVLADGLRGANIAVTRVIVYETVLLDPGPWHESWQPDIVVFASPSAVRAWCAWKLRPELNRVVSIGNATSEALHTAGIHVTAQAQRPDAEALCEEIVK